MSILRFGSKCNWKTQSIMIMFCGFLLRSLAQDDLNTIFEVENFISNALIKIFTAITRQIATEQKQFWQ